MISKKSSWSIPDNFRLKLISFRQRIFHVFSWNGQILPNFLQCIKQKKYPLNPYPANFEQHFFYLILGIFLLLKKSSIILAGLLETKLAQFTGFYPIKDICLSFNKRNSSLSIGDKNWFTFFYFGKNIVLTMYGTYKFRNFFLLGYQANNISQMIRIVKLSIAQEIMLTKMYRLLR